MRPRGERTLREKFSTRFADGAASSIDLRRGGFYASALFGYERYRVKTKDLGSCIDGFADLVVPSNVEAFRDRLFALILRALNPRRVLLFSIDDDELHYVAGTSTQQASVDRVRQAWKDARTGLAGGKAYTEAPKDAAKWTLVVVPVCAPKLAGLLSVELVRPARAEDVEVLQRLTRVAAITLRAPRTQRLLALSKADDYLRESTEDEILRDKILLELHANEWNIARVARRLGVTRRTVYLRLDRLGIERVRIRKTEPRKGEA